MNNNSMKAAVIGHPVAHSKSPIIHQYWLVQNNLLGSYEKIDIEPNNIKEHIQKIIDEGYDGFNVTVPHKQAIIGLCDVISETAKAIGAVNTVIIKDGKLFGDNTDAFGFLENIKSSKPDFTYHNKNAFVLGAGGAARAVIYGLIKEGVQKIKISNRTIEKAIEIQKMAPKKIEVIAWEERSKALSDIGLLINTTSLGMQGKDPLALNLSNLASDALVNDIVYAPLMTDLLNQAKERGNPFVTGIGMLLHQARPAFAAWTGILPYVSEELQKKVLA